MPDKNICRTHHSNVFTALYIKIDHFIWLLVKSVKPFDIWPDWLSIKLDVAMAQEHWSQLSVSRDHFTEWDFANYSND